LLELQTFHLYGSRKTHAGLIFTPICSDMNVTTVHQDINCSHAWQSGVISNLIITVYY
jgi:hypothetical protein